MPICDCHEHYRPRTNVEGEYGTKFAAAHLKLGGFRVPFRSPFPVSIVEITHPETPSGQAIVSRAAGLKQTQLLSADGDRIGDPQTNFTKLPFLISCFSKFQHRPPAPDFPRAILAFETDSNGKRASRRHNIVLCDVDIGAHAFEQDADLP